MTSGCPRCGLGLAPGSTRCSRCGAHQISTPESVALEYGMVDLGGAVAAGPPSLAVSVARPRRTTTRSRVQRRTSSARSATQPRVKSPAAAPQAPAPSALGGRMLGSDPLDGLGPNDGPALDLVDAPAARRASQPEPEPESAPNEPEETPRQKQARRVREIAQYGEAPAAFLRAPAYCVRVTLRKRALAEHVSELSAQRKQAETEAEDALARVGEALYALHKDVRLHGLARQLRAVAESATTIGAVQAAGQKRKADLQANLAEIVTRLRQLEHDAAPVRERTRALSQKLERLRARSRAAEAQRTKLASELHALGAKPGADPVRLSELQQQRDQLHAEVQTLGLSARPLEDDLAKLQAELDKLEAVIAKLESERAALATAVERAEQHARVESGSARGALRHALLSLARAGLAQKLGVLSPEHARAAAVAAEAAAVRRREEEIHRAAMNSYDARIYQHGAYTMMGASLALFLAFLLMIFL